MNSSNNDADIGASLSDEKLEAVACRVCDFENAVIVSRAKWCCQNCCRDFSLEYLFWAEAAHPEWIDETANA